VNKPLLHIFLLTYNREKSFRRTLQSIAASLLKDHLLTVMDNCSTDGTPQVCDEFRRLLPRMDVFRHTRNVGFGANYLRSIELSQGEYTWIICDDDTFFLEHAGALIDILQNACPEACFVGGPRQEAWPAGLNISPMDIQRRLRSFLTGQSFVPATVFKTSLLGSRDMYDAYFGIRTHFPQLVIGRKLLLQDIPCAVLRPPLLQRDDPAEKVTGYLDVVDGWSTFCHSLPSALRNDAFFSTFGRPDVSGMISELLRLIVWAKTEGGGDPGYHIARIGLNAGYPVRAALLICRLACLLPCSFYTCARDSYRKVKYGWLHRPLPANYHAPVTEDKLRR